MFIQPVPCDSDAFSHGKGGYNGTNSKSFDMSETESGEGSSDNHKGSNEEECCKI